jgi:(p)ppGpp synthase/HD superfamily hydrolase
MNDVIKEAAKFAIKAHGGQQYGVGTPYTYHLAQVYTLARRFGGSTDEQAAAWLHDVLEDTSVTKAELQQQFGSNIANIVDLVSNRESKEATFQRIRASKSAVFVKLCDRLANVTAGAKINMYRKQHPTFKSILYKKGEFENLWKMIDKQLE